MTQSLWTEIEAAGAGYAASFLASRKTAIVKWVGVENEIAATDLVAAIEKAEPGGFQMALVKSTLNKIINGLEAQEAAIVPTKVGELIDWCIAKLTAVANGKS